VTALFRPRFLTGCRQGACRFYQRIGLLPFSHSVILSIEPKREEMRKMKIRPLHDRVIVKRMEGEEKTKGGIIIPDTAKEKPVEGKVIAVGSGKVLENGKKAPLQVKEGDRILFGKYSGTEVKIDGEEHLIMREDDIIAIVE
jgi:chaperonin GroES